MRQAGGRLAFSYDLAAAGDVSLAIYDRTGRRVLTTTLAGKPGSNNAELSTTGFAGGVYFYRLESGSASTVGKFAVIR
jgi:hypothetical protein